MRKKNVLLLLWLLITTNVFAQECEIPMSIHLDKSFSKIPVSASNVLLGTLDRIATENGAVAISQANQFVLIAHCDVLDKSNIPGPPMQTVCNVGLSFYIADVYNKKMFSSAYLELDGVGISEAKSYINAFKQVKASNTAIKELVATGKAKIIEYYNSQYPYIIKEAKRLASVQKFEEAVFLLLSIPVCTAGADEAGKYILQLYMDNLDRMNLLLLNHAKSYWASGEASKTCEILSQIDPEAGCYADAVALMEEVKGKVHDDIDFEMRKKYDDKIQLQKEYLSTVKAVGVAYGQNQKPVDIDVTWLVK